MSEECYSIDENGNKVDAWIHEELLGDDDAISQYSIDAWRKAGLSEETIAKWTKGKRII